MTQLSQHEADRQVYEEVVQRAQEASVIAGSRIHRATAFNSTVSKAQDSSNHRLEGGQEAGRMKSGGQSPGGSKATYTHNKFKVKPSLSDFVCDVQITARRVLSESEFTYFWHTYFVNYLGIADMDDPLDLTPDGKDKYFARDHLTLYPATQHEDVIALDTHIRQKLGRAFIERDIFPFGYYMNTGDLDSHIAVEERKRIYNTETKGAMVHG